MDRQHPCQHGIYRTENLVRPTYWGDGHGRDAYVLSNGSGLRKDPDMWGSGRKPGWDICVQKGSHSKVYAGLRPGKPVYNKPPTSAVQYISDGSGRDTYVIKNHGGTCSEYRIGHVTYPSEYLRNTKKYPYETPIMDSRMQNKNINNVTYNNWPSMQAMKENVKNFEIQRSSISRLSPEPGSKINVDPVALEVHKNRVLERAKSSVKSGRAQTAMGNARAQSMRFAYLKKGAGMGQNFMERDIPTAGLFTREQMTINGVGPADRRNELARAQTNMRNRMDEKNLFNRRDTDALLHPQVVAAKTLEQSGFKPTQNEFKPQNAFAAVHDLDGDIKAEDLRARGGSKGDAYQMLGANFGASSMDHRKQSYQQPVPVDIGRLIERNSAMRSVSVTGSRMEQKRIKQSKQASAQFAKQFMAEAKQFLQSERPTRRNSEVGEPVDYQTDQQRLKQLRQQSLALNQKLKNGKVTKGHKRANTVMTQVDAPKGSLNNTLLKHQKQNLDQDQELSFYIDPMEGRYTNLQQYQTTIKKPKYSQTKRSDIDMMNSYMTPHKKQSITVTNTPGNVSGRNEGFNNFEDSFYMSQAKTAAGSNRKVNKFQSNRKSKEVSKSKRFRSSLDFNDK